MTRRKEAQRGQSIVEYALILAVVVLFAGILVAYREPLAEAITGVFPRSSGIYEM